MTDQKILTLNRFFRNLQTTTDAERVAEKIIGFLSQLFQCSGIAIYHFPGSKDVARVLAAAGSCSDSFPITISLDQVEKPEILLTGDRTSANQILNAGPLFPSVRLVPVQLNNKLLGLIFAADQNSGAFSPGDEPVFDTAATHLAIIWGHISRENTLADFVQSIGNLSMVQETGSLMEMISSIARRILDASFTVIAAETQNGWLLRSSGKAPLLLHSLENEAATFLDIAIETPYTFRLGDLRTDQRSACIQIDSPELHGLLASPILIGGQPSFLLLAFGKKDTGIFTEEDVFLAELLAAHAAQNLGSCFITEKLRHNLVTTKLLYDLSMQIAQADNLERAAGIIAETAFQLTHANRCGLLLLALDGKKEAEILIPPVTNNGSTHPYHLIHQAMNSRQTIYLSETDPYTTIAFPIQTQRRCYGALWLELKEDQPGSRYPTEEISALINQSTIALERFILLEETRSQARKLDNAYNNLDESYDQTLKALMRTLDARDRATEGHSERVADLAVRLGQELGLSKSELKSLARGSLLHDIGKIGISDSILLKQDSLTADEWAIMRRHPKIGAEIIQEIPALSDALQVIAFHQERWNGSGYPSGLRGKDIPLMARIFAVIDVYDALTDDRPYRTVNYSVDEAIQFLQEQAGILFDPEIVDTCTRMLRKKTNAKDEPDQKDLPTRYQPEPT